MDRYTDQGPGPDDSTEGVELLEDHTRSISRGGAVRRLGISLPGAVAGAFLITALAFGAALGQVGDRTPGGGDAGASTAQGGDGDGKDDEANVIVDEPKGENEDLTPVEPGTEIVTDGDASDADEPPADEPVADGPDADEPDSAEPDGEAPAEPDDPADTPQPKPDVTGMSLVLKLDGSRVIVDWSACGRDSFVAYKVIRSSDEKVTYPRGDNDVLVGAIENQATTAMADAPPGGRKLWYRVFGVVEWDGNPYTVACASDARGITTPEPKPEPTPQPEPKPDLGVLGLTVGIDGGHPWVDWTSCEIDGFDAYKVVRSTDSTVKFPAGDNDTVVAAVGPDGKTAVWDKEAPAGKKLWYRVFCIDKTETGARVLAASSAKAVETPVVEPKPLPDPKHMGFEVGVTDGGAIVLHWEPCGGDLFRYYKVVRSRSTNPSYLPGTDGSVVVAVFENAAVTEFVDGVDEGGTWYYRVQAIGLIDGQKFLLGQTDVHSVTLD